MATAEPASPFRRVVANTVSLSAAEFVGRLFSFLAVLHLSRVLLPAGLGVLDLGIALFALVQRAEPTTEAGVGAKHGRVALRPVDRSACVSPGG